MSPADLVVLTLLNRIRDGDPQVVVTAARELMAEHSGSVVFTALEIIEDRQEKERQVMRAVRQLLPRISDVEGRS
jgi:hypothetical protein